MILRYLPLSTIGTLVSTKIDKRYTKANEVISSSQNCLYEYFYSFLNKFNDIKIFTLIYDRDTSVPCYNSETINKKEIKPLQLCIKSDF